MRKTKLTAAALIATFLLALPISPVSAQTAHMFVSPSSVSAGIGESFTAEVMVEDIGNLAAYDFKVLYDPALLTVTGTSLGNTVFDLNSNGDVSDDPVLVARADVFNPIGMVRYAVVLLGGLSVTPTPSGSLLKLTFMVTFEFPTSISIGSSLISLVPGVGTVEVPHTSDGASYVPPASVAPRSVGCRADRPGHNVLAHGFTEGLFCRVINNGGQAIEVRADFSWRSIGGVVGSASSATMTLQPGEAAQLDSSITVPNASDIFIITGTPVRLTGGLTIPGDSDTFKLNVNIGQ